MSRHHVSPKKQAGSHRNRPSPNLSTYVCIEHRVCEGFEILIGTKEDGTQEIIPPGTSAVAKRERWVKQKSQAKQRVIN